MNWIVYDVLRHVLQWIRATLLSRQNIHDCAILINRQMVIYDMFDMIMCWNNMHVEHNCIGIVSWMDSG